MGHLNFYGYFKHQLLIWEFIECKKNKNNHGERLEIRLIASIMFSWLSWEIWKFIKRQILIWEFMERNKNGEHLEIVFVVSIMFIWIFHIQERL